jgi:hypoxanthine phosphoribosyltransferase
LIIVEDIIDTGLTMQHILKQLSDQEPASIKVASLFFKEACLKHEVQRDYIGFTIPDKFILGYGLDFDGYARNLEDVWVLKGQEH